MERKTKHARRNPAARAILIAAAGCAVSVGVLSAPATADEIVFNTIALSDQQAPFFPSGVIFADVADPRINNGGDVVFWARLEGPDLPPDGVESIWSNRTGVLAASMVKGDESPFGKQFTYDALAYPAINSDSTIQVTAALSGPITGFPTILGIVNRTIFLEDTGVARDASPIPGDPDLDFAYITPGAFNNASQTAFRAVSTEWDNEPPFDILIVEPQLWSDRDNGVAPIGDTDNLPGTGDVLRVDFGRAAQNADGAVAYRRSIGRLGVDPDPIVFHEIFTDRTGQSERIALTGDPAPGAGGATFKTLSGSPVINDSGHVAFHATLADSPDALNEGIWIDRGHGPELLARKGDAIPGLPGAWFNGFSSRTMLNSAGQLAVHARIAGKPFGPGADSAIFLITPDGEPTIIARRGEQAHGMPTGVNYFTFTDPALTESGRVVFNAAFMGGGSGPGTNAAIFTTNNLGAVIPVLRAGNEFDVAGDGSDPRTIRFVHFEPRSTGTGHEQINADGTLALRVEFTDWTSAIVTAAPCISADWNGDGVTDSGDLFDFLADWAAGDADFNGDGVTDSDDLLDFLTAWATGC